MDAPESSPPHAPRGASGVDPSEARLVAGDGLALEPEKDRDGAWRVVWQGFDWLGPIALGLDASTGDRLAGTEAFRDEDELGAYEGLHLHWEATTSRLRTSVRAYCDRPLLVFRTEARESLAGWSTGSFENPRVSWPHCRPRQRDPRRAPTDLQSHGHQYTEFAFPTLGGADVDRFLLFPHRPSVVFPLWLHDAEGRCLLLAPHDAFHEQIIAVPPLRPGQEPEPPYPGLRCGWHGDLDEIPAGFSSELGIWAGHGIRAVTEEWGAQLQRLRGTRRLSRYHDAVVAQPSYWTDNGAAYWYRTAPGRDMGETLSAVLDGLRETSVPFEAVELDSWFYPHAVLRPVSDETPETVPPTGTLAWQPREDVLPEGVPALRERLGAPPLILHARHYDRNTSEFPASAAWIDGDRAHPRDPAFFERLVKRAAEWGACCVEQDWLVELFSGVRGVREAPGRSAAWQGAMDSAAEKLDLSLLWCMATPADFLATLDLRRIVSIRTSGDYRFIADNPSLWVRFLITNGLARALGLAPFKDVFLSDPNGTGLDGDPFAEAEALLSALSAGPVGLGDRIGRTDREIVMRTCREDGVLLKPDVPIAATDASLRRDAFFEPQLLVGDCHSQHDVGRTVYVAAFNAWRGKTPLDGEVSLASLGVHEPVVALDWRSGEITRPARDGSLGFSLDPGDWSLRVLAPIVQERIAILGDLRRYATAADRRLARVRSEGNDLLCAVRGAAGEEVVLSGWAAGPLDVRAVGPDGLRPARPVECDPQGRFDLPLVLDHHGSADLRLRAR